MPNTKQTAPESARRVDRTREAARVCHRGAREASGRTGGHAASMDTLTLYLSAALSPGRFIPKPRYVPARLSPCPIISALALVTG